MSNSKKEPLTFNEVKALKGERIFLKHINGSEDFFTDQYISYFAEVEQYAYLKCNFVNKSNFVAVGCLRLNYYGKTWLAYLEDPKDGS